MRSLKVLGIFLCVLALGSFVFAGTNNMGIRDLARVSFSEPTKVGTAVLPAGEYTVRHTMEGQEHVMVFQRVHGKEGTKVKCNLVPLAQKAEQSMSIYQINAAKEKVLAELVFKGDTAKHVF